MLDGKKVIAIIPARGGSKRLPRKNILPLAGKPLIGWTIEAAKNSKYIDDIVVSTDDQEIAEVASQFGIKVPELRPRELSTDTATTQSVLFYTLEKYGKDSKIAILLQPTSPLRTYQSIDEALDVLIKKQAYSVVSVTPCEHSPLWANTLPSDLRMDNFISQNSNSQSQALLTYYRLNGAIYAYDLELLYKYKKLEYRNDSFAYIMKNEESLDIDSELDFKIANIIMEEKKNTELKAEV